MADNTVLDRQAGVGLPEVLEKVGQAPGRSVDDGTAVDGKPVVSFVEGLLDKLLGHLFVLLLGQPLQVVLPHVQNLASAVGVRLDVHEVAEGEVVPVREAHQSIGQAEATVTGFSDLEKVQDIFD